MAAKKQTQAKGTGDLPRLSRPAHSALAGVGITRLAQLSKHTEKEIAGLHGMGPKGIKELKGAMRAKGLKFAPPSKP